MPGHEFQNWRLFCFYEKKENLARHSRLTKSKLFPVSRKRKKTYLNIFFFFFSSAASLEPTYRQLESMKLDRSPFVLISVVGQELLAQGRYRSAVEVLEAALRIGTCSLKLRGSVFSALSSAYWAINNLDKVIRNSRGRIIYAK